MEETKTATTDTSAKFSHPNWGWTCPNCQKVWAPWVSSCDCSIAYNWTVTCNDDMNTDGGWYDYYTKTVKANTVGSSDYWNIAAHSWGNVRG